MPQNALKLITFVKGRLDFSCKNTTAANVDLTESLLDNWLKNNHITVDIIINDNNFNYEYITFAVCLYFFNCEFQISNLLLNRNKPAQKQNAVATL